MSSCSSSAVLNLGERDEREALNYLLENEEAEACRRKAEELFKEGKFDMAICAIERARLKITNNADFNGHYASYLVHKLAAEKNNWYAVLGIRDYGSAVDVIKKRYEGMLQLFQPSNCSSVAVDTAIMLINEAWAVLSVPKSREAYDMLMGYNNNKKRLTRSVRIKNRVPVCHNNVDVKVEDQNLDQDLENCNRPSISERIRANRGPSTTEAASSSSPAARCFLHRNLTKRVLVIRKNNGQGMGDNNNAFDKVIIITRK